MVYTNLHPFRTFEKRPMSRPDASLVRSFDMFAKMDDAYIEAVLALSHTRRIAEGEAVFQQGDPAGEFFLLLEGRLKVSQVTPDGRQVVVRHVNPGDLYGIARALRRDDYPGTAIAVTESRTLAWDSRHWDDFVARIPSLAVSALQTVGQRLQEAHTRIRELSTEEVQRRVAHALLRLVNQAGKKTEEGILIDFPITRQDIAEMTGTTLHTVSRILSAWEEQGLIGSGRKRIVLKEPHKLMIFAERGRDGS